MNARAYLEQISLLDAMVNNKIKELKQLRDMAYSIRSPSNISDARVQSSMDGDKFGAVIAKICDAEDEINEMIDKLVDLRKEVISTIERIPEADVYDVIHKRYVQFLTFESIAEAMNISEPWAFKLHARGLQIVQSFLQSV